MGVTLLALARYTLKGPYRAAAVVGLLAVLAVFIPPMAPNSIVAVLLASISMMVSCILVGLIILTQGSVSGLKAIGAAVVGITLVAWMLINAPYLGLWTALVQWMPIILMAQTLRSSKSLSLTLLLGVLLGAIGIAAQYLVWTDLEREWVNLAVQRMGQAEQIDEGLIKRNVELVRLFALALIAMGYLIVVVILLIARWVQAGLAESRGFGEEFRALTLGKPAATAALVLMLASFWVHQPWLNSLSFLVVIAFMFQGIAVVHSKLTARKQSGLLLGLYYALLAIFPQVVALTALTGVIDNWIVFRRKPESSDDETEN